MKLRDWKEIGMWACLTAVLVVGVLASTGAVSDNPPPRGRVPTFTVNGCEVTASANPATELYKVEVSVSVNNPTEKTVRFDLPVTLVRRDFTGDPGSRVIRPADYKITDEATETVHFAAASMKASVKTLTMAIDARPPSGKAGSGVPIYEVRVGSGKDAKTLASFGANVAWPKK